MHRLRYSAVFLLTACSSSLGDVSTDLVALYDIADPAGVIELEIDRNGAIREMEADVPIRDVPLPIRQAALAEVMGGTITGAERELQSAGWAWEVKVSGPDGIDYEFVFNDSGRIVETERELRPAQVPGVITARAEAVIPDAQTISVEIIERGEEREFHVKRRIGDVVYKVVLTPAGEVIRAVREHRAEIEIPIDW